MPVFFFADLIAGGGDRIIMRHLMAACGYFNLFGLCGERVLCKCCCKECGCRLGAGGHILYLPVYGTDFSHWTGSGVIWAILVCADYAGSAGIFAAFRSSPYIFGLSESVFACNDEIFFNGFLAAVSIQEIFLADGAMPVFSCASLTASDRVSVIMRHRMTERRKCLHLTKGCVAPRILACIVNRAFRGAGSGLQHLLKDVRLLRHGNLEAGTAAAGGNIHCVCAGLFCIVIGFDGVRHKLGGDIFAAALQGYAKSVQRQGFAISVIGFDLRGIQLDAHGLYQANGVARTAGVGQIALINSKIAAGKVGFQIDIEGPAGFQITKFRIAQVGRTCILAVVDVEPVGVQT